MFGNKWKNLLSYREWKSQFSEGFSFIDIVEEIGCKFSRKLFPANDILIRKFFLQQVFPISIFTSTPQDESSVQNLIENCIIEDDKLYICVSSPTIKNKPVQIRPWRLSDADFVLDASMSLDPRKTVFVGGVPRPLKACKFNVRFVSWNMKFNFVFIISGTGYDYGSLVRRSLLCWNRHGSRVEVSKGKLVQSS